MVALQALERRTTELDEEPEQKARALETASHELEAKSKVIDALTQRPERLGIGRSLSGGLGLEPAAPKRLPGSGRADWARARGGRPCGAGDCGWWWGSR